MAGELWTQVWGIGKEVTPGLVVPATRRVYLREPMITRERAPRPYRFATGTRDNVRAQTLGPEMIGGSISMPLSAGELVEWALAGIRGGVTPTTPGGATNARLWTFTPGTALDPMTIERKDGARNRQARGVYVGSMQIAGSVREENLLTCELFGLSDEPLDNLTAGLTDRIPSFHEGWETKLYIDAIGGTPGTTNIAGTLINWSVGFNNQMARKYFADNTLATGAVILGELDLTGQLLFEASSAQALTEYVNWDDQVGRLVRLEFGQNRVIDAGTNEVQTLTITGTPTGGTFTLTYAGHTTAALPYNATAAQVQSALRALGNIGYQDVVCAGGPLPGAGITITFQGRLAGTNVAAITTTDSLTGGTTPASAIATTTAGAAGMREYVTVDLPGQWSAFDLGQTDEGTRAYALTLQGLYDVTNAYGFQLRAQNARTAAYA